jgi:hypothetical protein
MFALILIVCAQKSYSEDSDYVIQGTGYGISKGKTEHAALQISLRAPSIQTPFQEGQLVLGSQVHSIKELDLSFYGNNKFFRLDGITNDNIVIKAAGKSILSNQEGTIYYVKMQASKDFSEQIFFFANLKQANIQGIIQAPTESQKQNVLLLVEHKNRVQWKDLYKFTVRVFDPKINPNPNFNQNTGYLSGINVDATITDPRGQVFKTVKGTIPDNGYFVGNVVIPDNLFRGFFTLDITVSESYINNATKRLSFEVIPIWRSD